MSKALVAKDKKEAGRSAKESPEERLDAILEGMSYNILDLFCGGGGSGDGILGAYKLLGRKVRGTFVNHSETAIDIHEANHPEHRHLCTGVDDVDIDILYPEGTELNFLWGSPECTHHSVARGGKPVNAQSRATAWCLIRWIRRKRPDQVLVLEFDGQFFILDIYFRMLTPRELARAQGFRDDFEFPVTKTAAVKAIGNAVSRNTATALVLAAINQDPDVGKHIKEWK